MVRASAGLYAIVVLLAAAAFGTGCASPIRYLDAGYGERLAAQQNKPLLFYFKAWDSTQHRNMVTSVFESSPVQAEMRDIVTVEVEFAWSEPYRSRYGVQQPQVCVMCRPDGTKVGGNKYVNPVPTPEEFAQWLREAKSMARGESGT